MTPHTNRRAPDMAPGHDTRHAAERWCVLRCSNTKTLELAASLADAGFDAWSACHSVDLPHDVRQPLPAGVRQYLGGGQRHDRGGNLGRMPARSDRAVA